MRSTLVMLAWLAASLVPNMATAAATKIPADERAALRAIDERTASELNTITRTLATLAPGLERRALLRRAVEIKSAAELERLRTMLTFARARGDQARAAEVERRITDLTTPRPVPPLTPQVKTGVPTSGR